MVVAFMFPNQLCFEVIQNKHSKAFFFCVRNLLQPFKNFLRQRKIV